MSTFQECLNAEVCLAEASEECSCLNERENGPHGRRVTDPEPDPKPKDENSPAIWDLVISDMQQRSKDGEEKYGVKLRAWNGRNALVDAYQEMLDGCVYLRQAIEEQNIEVNTVTDDILESEQRPDYRTVSGVWSLSDYVILSAGWSTGHRSAVKLSLDSLLSYVADLGAVDKEADRLLKLLWDTCFNVQYEG